MGRFFTSTQIYNPNQLDRDGFKAYFCEKMKKEGYEHCEADCAELSYVLAFADNCKWVTISSEAYEQGNQTSQADTARIARMLGKYCVNTIVIDSDCAMLNLYDDKGKKADTAVMGRADDYFGDDITEPSKAVWEQFLSSNSTWEQFMSVVQGDYVFVEDGLSELAPVIEMDSENILFEFEDANDRDENVQFLSFRKSSLKKEKKLTLNAAFEQVFGEALEPLGFQKVKGKQPYYVRIIGSEIIHIIGIHDMKTHLFAFGGVATIYRPKLCLDKSFQHNERWLTRLNVFCSKNRSKADSVDTRIFSGFPYRKNDNLSIQSAFIDMLKSVLTWIVPEVDKIETLQEYCNYSTKYFGNVVSIPQLPLSLDGPEAEYSDGAVLYLLDDPMEELNKRVEMALEDYRLYDMELTVPLSQDIIDERSKRLTKRVENSRNSIRAFQENIEIQQHTLAILALRKESNTNILRSYEVL